jgi:hypothetical protein
LKIHAEKNPIINDKREQLRVSRIEDFEITSKKSADTLKHLIFCQLAAKIPGWQDR